MPLRRVLVGTQEWNVRVPPAVLMDELRSRMWFLLLRATREHSLVLNINSARYHQTKAVITVISMLLAEGARPAEWWILQATKIVAKYPCSFATAVPT